MLFYWIVLFSFYYICDFLFHVMFVTGHNPEVLVDIYQSIHFHVDLSNNRDAMSWPSNVVNYEEG